MAEIAATPRRSHIQIGVPEAQVEMLPAELRDGLENLARLLVENERIVLEPPEELDIPPHKLVAVPLANLAVSDKDARRLGPELAGALRNAVVLLRRHPSVSEPPPGEVFPPPPPVVCGIQHKWLGEFKPDR
jgi:hypothetical protein